MKTIAPANGLCVLTLVLLSACAALPAPRVGADRDAHGCIGSAGYAWCAREAACVRPWELATGAKGFADYCRLPEEGK